MQAGSGTCFEELMSSAYEIAQSATPADLADIARLFQLYADTLPINLDYQDFETELSSLPGKYAPPEGALFLARNGDGHAIGCVGIRPLEIPGLCEMKRLYTLPTSRGIGLGRGLTKAVIECVRALGYSEMRLDTLASMTAAIRLYEQHGFRPCAPYYAPTPAGTVFMALKLET